VTPDHDDLIAELREESLGKQSVAWNRTDGGQDHMLSAQLADRAADTIAALETAYLAAMERCAELERALTFYADPDMDGYDIHITDYGLSTQNGPIIKDGGAIARAAPPRCAPSGMPSPIFMECP